jgi:hypothetical protein
MKIGKIEMKTYNKSSHELERNHLGKVVAITDGKIAAIGKDINSTLKLAEKRYPRKTFYVRKIGKNPEAIFIL